MTRALLIIDIQNDYFPGGRMELTGSAEAGERARELLIAFRQKRLPVIHMQHVSIRPGATFFLPGTKGTELHDSVTPEGDETVFQKHYPNSFHETPLLEHLRKHDIAGLAIAGMMTHMCVDTTVRAAFDLGLKCYVAHDACATRSLSFKDTIIPAHQVHASFMASLSGLFATVQSAADLRADL
jgi:nicotinamidase-related amidase